MPGAADNSVRGSLVRRWKRSEWKSLRSHLKPAKKTRFLDGLTHAFSGQSAIFNLIRESLTNSKSDLAFSGRFCQQFSPIETKGINSWTKSDFRKQGSESLRPPNGLPEFESTRSSSATTKRLNWKAGICQRFRLEFE
jgi:hypothetical protein